MPVRERVRRDDIHPPRRQRPRDIRKQQRPIPRHQRQLVPMRRVVEVQLHRILLQPRRHRKVGSHLLRSPRPQIPLRQPVQKPLHLRPLLRQLRRHPVHKLVLLIHPDAFVIHAAIQIIRRHQVQPPQVFRLPRRQRMRMNRIDVRIREQRQHAQRLVRLNLGRERPHRVGIKNIPP